ncbi:uncharacterized protein LOC117101526 isoform X2 [Anneissia japonica]|uniref:uncharacterized protein LOC117101526 isoform X2 n=1 Tax=Anneissia japonica TaxID=1529436 RepID=UPI001425907A|nr:uncharacterized protein LOC117101526 isoform X2 [Anneissia japonica]
MAKLETGQQLIGGICLVVALLHVTNADDYGFDASSDNVFGAEDEMSHIIKDNGMLQLVLHELAVNLIEKLQSEESTQLHERQVQIIQDDILDFYNKILDHPALNNDRIVFAQRKPNFRRILPPSVIKAEEEKSKRSKRSAHLKEICSSVSNWKELDSGMTRTQNEVRLLEDQFFYVTECTNPSAKCENISPLFSSKCWEKSSWNIAYVWSTSTKRYIWDWIAVSTCCSCAAAKEN